MFLGLLPRKCALGLAAGKYAIIILKLMTEFIETMFEYFRSEAVFLGLLPRKCVLGLAAGLELLCIYLSSV